MKLKYVFSCTALFTASHAEPDHSSLLQQPVRHMTLQQERKPGIHLLETTNTLISKINAGDDPSGCAIASEASRAAIEEAIPAIVVQHQHMVNQIQIAEQTVQACLSEGSGLADQGVDLQTARENHQECRRIAHDLEDGLSACQQYEELRETHGNKCFAFPNEEEGFPTSVQQAKDELDFVHNQAVTLKQSCDEAKAALAAQNAQCEALQRSFEQLYCSHRSDCHNVHDCYANTVDTYEQTEIEIRASLESLHSEYQVLKHVECLLDHADEALQQSSIVAGDLVSACSVPASTDELSIDFPTLGEPTTCASEVMYRAPCDAGFVAAEYENLPNQDSIQAACNACPALTVITAGATTPGGADLRDLSVGQAATATTRDADFTAAVGCCSVDRSEWAAAPGRHGRWTSEVACGTPGHDADLPASMHDQSCAIAVTFLEARQICADLGARLCHATEVAACYSTGCGHYGHNRDIWIEP